MLIQETTHMHQPAARRLRAFTLVELLVVIGIIALLVGILLPALAAVNVAAKNTRTTSTLTEFSKACDLFQQEHGFYPGVFSEEELADWGGGIPPLSGTENALLHLMGGYLSPTDPNYASTSGVVIQHPGTGKEIKVVDKNNDGVADGLGDGPIINGKRFSSYYAPAGDALAVTRGQAGPVAIDIPDVLDAWGQPIIYVRRARGIGPLVDAPGNPAQFYSESMTPYTESTNLGELNQPQHSGNSGEYSLLSENALNAGDVDINLATLITNMAFFDPNNRLAGTAKGSYALISAGEDGVYFNRNEDVNPNPPGFDIIFAPVAVREYDDLVIAGGGQ